MRSRR